MHTIISLIGGESLGSYARSRSPALKFPDRTSHSLYISYGMSMLRYRRYLWSVPRLEKINFERCLTERAWFWRCWFVCLVRLIICLSFVVPRMDGGNSCNIRLVWMRMWRTICYLQLVAFKYVRVMHLNIYFILVVVLKIAILILETYLEPRMLLSFV